MSSSAASDMSDSESPAASPAQTTPPTSPSKSSPPSSPKKAAAANKNAAKKDEAKKSKEVEKIKKFRGTQREKVLKTVEKHRLKAKTLLDKLSEAWDAYALSAYQIKLLDNGQVDDAEQLKTKTEAYQEGDEIAPDFVKWVKSIYDPDEEEEDGEGERAGKNGTEEKVDMEKVDEKKVDEEKVDKACSSISVGAETSIVESYKPCFSLKMDVDELESEEEAADEQDDDDEYKEAKDEEDEDEDEDGE